MPNKANNISAARKVYETYWESYAKGDLETFASTLDDNYEMIGTSESEICHSKADGIAFFKGQMHEVVGKAEMRNRQIDVLPVDNLILVNEQCDVYVLVDSDWNFYSKIRISSFLRENESGWKVIQQHGSLPDMRVGEGETLAIDKINRENLELRDAVKRRTAELESKNKELAIESALERVRSRTMAMQNSNELSDVVSALYQQMETLGFAKYGCELILCNEKSGLLEYWHTNPMQSSVPECYCVSPEVHAFFKKVWKAWKQKTPMLVIEMKNQEKRKLDVALLEKTDFKRLDKKTKNWILKEKVAVFSHVTMKYGLLVTIDSIPISAEQLSILHRFANVFEQSYTRFLDLQKAEAQAREARIEAALERVRSRSMAMHNSSELKEVVLVLYQQLDALGLADWGCEIMIFDEKANRIENWVSESTGSDLSCYIVEGQRHSVFERLWQHWRQQGPPLTLHHTDKVKLDFDNFWLNETGFSSLPDEVKKSVLNEREVFLSYITMRHGMIGAAGYLDLPEEKITILQRFAKVFEQTYTRFLDLQKAEAQAKEAKIEAALERVRSRSMAMHRTDELQEVVRVVAEELKNTGVILDTWGAVICTYFQDSKDVLHWTASEDPANPSIAFLLPYFKDELFDEAWESKERGDSYFAKVFSFEVKNAFFNHAFEHSDYRQLPDGYKKQILESETHGIAWAWAKNSAIMIPSIQGDLPSEDEKEILIRFARVFEQSFIRFLDLQKAEAQAREAQIEAALERVRSRSMAMHKSEELAEVSLILFEQVEKLGIKTWSTGFNVWLEGDTSYIDWVVNSASRKFIEPYKVDLSVHPSFMEISSAKKQGDVFFVHETEGETLEELYRLLSQMAKTQFEDIVKAGFQLPEHQFNHYVFGSKVSLMFITFDPCPEAHEIFKRFGKVFEQTYTRFLDLQKAEEQAREAEIQLALERVRARTMAMHRSEELGEVAILLYKEFNALKMGDFFNCGFVIVNEADSVQNGWMTQPEGTFIEELDLPYPGDVVLKKRAKAWKEGTPVFCDKVSGEKLEIHIKYVRDHSKSANQVNTQLPYMPDPCYFYCGNFAQGYLHILAKEELRPEDEVVLSRFTKVFEQTYTRFLDLQRAEAQAREAQIEVSLERVRSRAMAMHKSEELGEVAELLYKELQKLGITDFINCGYIEVDEQNKTQYGWITNSEGKAMERFYLPLVGESVLDDRYEARMRKDPIFCQTVAGEMLKEHLRFVSPQLGSEEALQNAVNNFPDPTIFYCGNFSHGYLCIITGTPLTSEKEALLARFTRVFEMTYKRFLDLQKAEEQAREAQIEAALERVRSRSMAMHKSEELSEVAVLLYEELKGLGLTQFFNCGYVEVRESENRQYVYTSTFEGKWAEGHTIPLTGDKIFDARYKAWKSQVPVFQQIVGGMKLKKHLEYSSPPASVIEITSNFPDPSVFYCCNFSKGYLHIITEAQLNDEAESLLGRFAKVFEQTYTRFLDLQKAEAQAKEAEIELALERVRARTMAMHHSDELIEVVKTLNKQFLELRPESVANWLSLVNVESNSMKIIGSVMNGLLQEYIANGSELPSYQNDLDEFKKGIPHWQFSLPKEEILRIWRESFEFDEADLPEGVTKYHLLHIRHTFGFYGFGSWEKADEETIAILSRFCKVFEQTYTRFLDLQKAEAQAREAEIELALERVRAKTMAMQKSDELSDVAALLFKQIKILGAELWTISIAFCKEDGLIVEKWGGSPITDQIFAPNFIPYNADHGEQSMYNTWKNKVELYSYVQEGKELKDIYDHLMTIPSFKANFQKVIDSGRPLPVWQKNHVASFKYGYLLVITEEEFKEEYVFTRFAKVFEQTYTRFLDLQKAEAQTREAQIEAALERVRSRSMAMHNSEDLIHVATEMNQQFNKLGITQSLQAGFVLLDEEKELQYLWGGQTDSKLLEFITIPLFGDHVLQTRYEAWKRKDPVLNTVLASEDLRKHMEVVMPAKGLSEREMEASNSMPDPCYFCCGNFKYGYLIVISTDVLTEEQHKIVARMAKVFEQTYTRFLDLQKAEAQAREAQIQLSLERVRARAMAMHKSEELSEVATALYKELRSLAFAYPFFNCGYVEVDEKNKTQHGWMTTPNGDFLERFNLPLVGDGVLQTRYAAWKQKTPVFCQKVGGSELKNHIKFVTPNFGAERMVEMVRTEFPDSVFFNCGNFSNGYLHVVTGTQISASEELLLARFTQAFEMTYTRFLDLQKAEARERDAIKQASVDRVRAEIASMRTTTDLERITPLIWNELTTLGVPFIRCGVFIMDEENQQVQTHLSTPDGKAIAAFQLNYEATNQSRQIVSHWREKKIFKDHMDEVAFAEFTKNLVQQGAISSNEKYVTENRPTNLHLHFFPFLQGMLYVGNTAPLSDDELHLAQNLADAFSTAYARYEDFKKLELAKSAVESAMIELKATQTQLIQQEKLASLGQLTAGIAHEIKNPLNFVNNFSEVSIEMIEEVQEERIKSPESRDEGLVDEILEDIKSNLQKVHEHGTRANTIVSSMLQHSRGGSGKMEPTDLNALIKEYVNLSFHGMRAGKNPINVDIQLHLDETLGKVNLIGEDFSRVVLNLVNNAFDAMREKTKTEPDYKPVLSIYTRSIDRVVEISIGDNGPGIPEEIKDKILQPFFTTKKGTEGTGLGLSITHDIVKAHGGELKVETKAGGGSEFVIQLPVV